MSSLTYSRTLGQGAFATVKLATSLETGELFAVKVIKRSALKPVELQGISH